MIIGLTRLAGTLSRGLALGVALGAVAVGCGPTEQEIGNDVGGSNASGSGAQGSGAAGAQGGSSSEGGGPSQGGGGSGSGATGTGGLACYGDQASWAAVTQTPIACTKNSDCCVIINYCLSEAQVVHATDVDAAKTAWPYCDADCNDCIPPDVEVFCLDNQCVGVASEPTGGDVVDHCGIDENPGTGGTTGEHFGCG